MDPIDAAMLAVPCVAVSCWIAAIAGRGRGSAGWGLLGPVGWIVAAIHSTDHGPPPRPADDRG